MAAISSRDYWAERAVKREEEAFLRGSAATAKLFTEYEAAASAIQKEISSFYAKYAGKHGLTYDQAVKTLSRPEFQAFKASLGEYMDMIASQPDPAVRAVLKAQLDALSINSSLSRLEALQGQVNMILGQLYDRGVRQMKDELGETFVQAYYTKSFDIQSRAGFFNEIAKIDAGIIEDVASYPWSGAMFSERLWRNTNALIFGSREIIAQGMIEGKSVAVMAKTLSDFMGKSYKSAERLIRTETNYFHNAGVMRSFKKHGVKWYEFVATLDARTCATCGALDGQHFKVEDAVPGVNHPPIHPNDRCCVVEWDPEETDDWAASGEPMPKRTTYQDWYDEQVARNGQGSVEIERQKLYNERADREQYEEYADRLGDDAPASFDAFQSMKYQEPEAWAETKSFFSYKGRVPEATKGDFQAWKQIREMGVKGTVRVPALPPQQAYILEDLSVKRDPAHIMKRMTERHITDDMVQSYVDNALFSVTQFGGARRVFYSSEGVTVLTKTEDYPGVDWIAKTTWSKYDFDEMTESIVKEALKNAE